MAYNKKVRALSRQNFRLLAALLNPTQYQAHPQRGPPALTRTNWRTVLLLGSGPTAKTGLAPQVPSQASSAVAPWNIASTKSPNQRHCQSKFYTACSRTGASRSSTVFAHELPTRSAGFDAENHLYLFALTVPQKKRRGMATIP
jgi:hypothetical protein